MWSIRLFNQAGERHLPLKHLSLELGKPARKKIYNKRGRKKEGKSFQAFSGPWLNKTLGDPPHLPPAEHPLSLRLPNTNAVFLSWLRLRGGNSPHAETSFILFQLCFPRERQNPRWAFILKSENPASKTVDTFVHLSHTTPLRCASYHQRSSTISHKTPGNKTHTG